MCFISKDKVIRTKGSVDPLLRADLILGAMAQKLLTRDWSWATSLTHHSMISSASILMSLVLLERVNNPDIMLWHTVGMFECSIGMFQADGAESILFQRRFTLARTRSSSAWNSLDNWRIEWAKWSMHCMKEIISELSTVAKLLMVEDGMGYGMVISESDVSHLERYRTNVLLACLTKVRR